MTSEFETSNPLLNQLQSNILWSQKGNILSIPTDCPQRERAGWTGDAWVYGETCCYNQNMYLFFRHWLKEVRLEQFDNGLIPVVVPYSKAYEELQVPAFGTHTSAGWGDVIVALPWYLYQAYGDIEILKENFEAMHRWMKYVENEAEDYLWDKGFHFGDWLYPSCKDENQKTDMHKSAMTTKEYVATAIYAYSTLLFSKVCDILGQHQLSEYYGGLNKQIRKAFDEKYVDNEGRIKDDFQGVYVMALAMDMVSESKKSLMAAHLIELIKKNGDRLDTGFMSIKFLMDVLKSNGYKETAKKILYQEKCPSWLYEVKMGATTIWETWDAISPDGTVNTTSYNHYAFGCIGDWMYRNLIGINKKSPGYKEVLIKPDFDFDLDYASGAYESLYGKISVKWTKKGKARNVSIDIPVNTTGYFEAEDIDWPTLKINGEPVGNKELSLIHI